jgi:hypothetical protein
LPNGENKGAYAKTNGVFGCKARTIMKTCCACSNNHSGMSDLKSLSAYLSETRKHPHTLSLSNVLDYSNNIVFHEKTLLPSILLVKFPVPCNS